MSQIQVIWSHFGALRPWIYLKNVALITLVVILAGCGSSPRAAMQGGSEPAPSAASIDFNATADCLDQYSGDGATRSREGIAQTASVSVPKDSGWDSYLSVEVYVFPSASAAASFNKSDRLDPSETLVTGNAIANGSAIADDYSKQLVTKCLVAS